ncbi:hypothetical protein ACFQ0M_20325 [Kitasatospora aburaviensis]
MKVREDPPCWDFAGDEIPLPTARPMARVPRGGWAADPSTAPTDPEVERLIGDFNQAFSTMLHTLELAWQKDDREDAADQLELAIAGMFDLAVPAGDLMEKPLPNDPTKRYGPEFRFLPPA